MLVAHRYRHAQINDNRRCADFLRQFIRVHFADFSVQWLHQIFYSSLFYFFQSNFFSHEVKRKLLIEPIRFVHRSTFRSSDPLGQHLVDFSHLGRGRKSSDRIELSGESFARLSDSMVEKQRRSRSDVVNGESVDSTFNLENRTCATDRRRSLQMQRGERIRQRSGAISREY